MTDELKVILGFIVFFVVIYILYKLTLSSSDIAHDNAKREEREEANRRAQAKYQDELKIRELERKRQEEERQREIAEARREAKDIISKKMEIGAKFINDTTQKIRKQINNAISKHYLTSFGWVQVQLDDKLTVYHFKSNNELIVSIEGNVTKGSYELLNQNNSLLISIDGITEHFNIVNVQNDYFFLNKVSTKNIIAFVNQNKYRDENKAWFMKEMQNVKEKLV